MPDQLKSKEKKDHLTQEIERCFRDARTLSSRDVRIFDEALRKISGKTRNDAIEIWKEMDKSGDEKINFEEFREYCCDGKEDNVYKELFEALDTNSSGVLDSDEFFLVFPTNSKDEEDEEDHTTVVPGGQFLVVSVIGCRGTKLRDNLAFSTSCEFVGQALDGGSPRRYV